LTVQVDALLSPVNLGSEFQEKLPARLNKASSVLMRLEGLEERKLLSSVGLDNGVLRLDGSASDVNLMSVVTADRTHLTATVNDKNITVNTSDVKSIQITGGDQSDSIYVASDITIGANINGLGGNDFIQGGGGNNVIHGGAGDDYISGGAGNNTLFTDGGKDILVVNPTTDSWDVGSGAGKIIDARNSSALPNRSSTAPVDNTPPKNDTPPVDNTPPKNDTPPVDNTPPKNDTPPVDNTPPKNDTPPVDNTPPKNDTPPVDNTPPKNDTPPVDNTPPKNDTPPVDNTPPKNDTPPVDNTPPKNDTPPVDNTPPKNDTPPVDNTPPKNDTPPVDNGTGNQEGSGQAPAGGSSNSTPPAQNPSDPPQNNGGATPTAKITTLETSAIAGSSINVDATSSALGTGDPTTTRYEWNFGDSGSQYNTLDGFNAAHAYDKAGTYTITLRITNALGNQSVATQKVTITPDDRRTIYVSSDGNDSNSGLSANSAVRTIDRVSQLLQDNTRVLFKAGQSFDLTKGLVITQNNVLLGSYGSGSRPALNWRAGNPNGNASLIDLTGDNAVVRGLTFDTPADANRTEEGSPFALQIRGKNSVVRDNQFLNLGYAINGNSKPVGVLVQNNVAPSPTGIEGYFVWCEGSNYTIVGNTVANSTREHIVRMENTRLMNVSYNNFTNLDRTAQGDSKDNSKGTIVVHANQYAWISHNTINDGPIGTGPLSIPSVDASARTQWSVIDSNILNNTIITADTGTDGAVFRNNIIHPPVNSAWGFQVVGYSSTYQRGVEDLRVLNNTVVSNLSGGGFLYLSGRAQGITMDNNLFVDHNLTTGAYQAALVYVEGSDLSSFREIKGNIWDIPNTLSYAQGGYFYVWPSWSDSAGYLTPQEWDALPQVSGEQYGNISLNSQNAPITQLAASGAKAVQGVFTDFTGAVRPSNGSWSAGAVQA
jgi:hypothetical protein